MNFIKPHLAGIEFVCFTLNWRDKWENLKSECKEATSDKFCAIPGLEFIDRAGNHSLVLAPVPWPDPAG